MLFKANSANIDVLYANSRVLGKQLKQQDASLNSHSDSLFLVGERVWIRDFRMRFPNKWIAGTVVARSGPLSYVVQVGSECWRRHQDQMRASDPHRNYERGNCCTNCLSNSYANCFSHGRANCCTTSHASSRVVECTSRDATDRVHRCAGERNSREHH